MLIRLLGPIEVTGDAAIRFAGLRRKAVLTMLALHRGEVVGSDLLIDILWGDSPPENPANALQRHISYLRRVLADRDAIVARPPGYVLNVARGCIDVERVEDLRCASRLETDPIAAERLLAEAHRMWRGRAMAELDGLPGMAPAIEQVRQLQLSIAQELVELRIILGHHVDVIPALKSLLAEFPLQEHLHALLIVALYGSGRQADALAAHRAARRLIVEELGVDPGRELEGLESAILRGDELQTIAGILTRVAHRSTARQGTQQHQSRPTPGPAPRPIPRPRNSFVGRTEEQAQLALAVGRSRLVTLVGPGGSGKTRLCLQLLQRSDLGFGDGRAFADLTASTDVTVHRDVAAAVGLPADHEDIEMHLAAALASRDMLLVLDNCEHVIEPVVKLVERLLADCPVLTILATSRQLLDVDGEECFSLSPLAVPSTGPPVGDPRSLLAYHSVALLLDRAQARNPGFRITNENAGAVAGLCRLLDGLPLAIELAAARLRSMTPNELAQGLDSPHTQPRSSTRQSPGNTLLSVPEGASAGRHRSLTAALQWSTDLLTSAELAVFRRFAVFVGGASSEQATQICYPDDPVRAADLLDGLVAKSLLRWESEVSCGMGRFAMHETVRRHAAELLASSGESAQIERAYAQPMPRLSSNLPMRQWSPCIHHVSRPPCSGSATKMPTSIPH